MAIITPAFSGTTRLFKVSSPDTTNGGGGKVFFSPQAPTFSAIIRLAASPGNPRNPDPVHRCACLSSGHGSVDRLAFFLLLRLLQGRVLLGRALRSHSPASPAKFRGEVLPWKADLSYLALWREHSAQHAPAGSEEDFPLNGAAASTTTPPGAFRQPTAETYAYYYYLHEAQRLGRRLPLPALALAPCYACSLGLPGFLPSTWCVRPGGTSSEDSFSFLRHA